MKLTTTAFTDQGIIPGEFAFAVIDPATHVRLSANRNPDFAWTAERADDWRKPWDGFSRTRYEAKAIREGRTPAYFIFQRL